MEVKWIKSKYGYELIEEYSESQIALLKYDKDGSDEYYISCIDSHDIGREYLDTNDLEEAKILTIEAVVEMRESEINDIQNHIDELKKLIEKRSTQCMI